LHEVLNKTLIVERMTKSLAHVDVGEGLALVVHAQQEEAHRFIRGDFNPGVLCQFFGAVPLSREGSFNVPSAHQPGRKDAPWKLKVNGVTTPLAPTAARLTRTTSKCTATLKDAFAAPPVNALSVPTRARSLKHCAPHARSSWTSLRCSSSATACGLSAESNTVQLMPRCTCWIWPGSKAPPSIAPSSGMCIRRRCRSMRC